MPTALVTGITGQDGGYLAEQLVAAGSSVVGVVRAGETLPAHLETLGEAVRTVSVDLLDAQAVAALVADVTPSVVYSLAGISSVAQSWAEPALTVSVNGLAVAHLLEACWQTGRPRFVQASSAELFAGTDVVPQDETTPVRPTTPYGAAKALAHHLVGVYRGRGLHASSMVLYNHESPRRPTTFVTRKITAGAAAIARGAAGPLRLGNLDARRDWGWAPEYVDALVRAAAADTPDDYVVATGTSHSVADFVAAAFAAAGLPDWPSHVESDPSLGRPGDAVDLVGDPARAAEQLGWRPTVHFEELVRRMVEADLEASSPRRGSS